VRSISIEQHEDPERVERYVRYCAKYEQEVWRAVVGGNMLSATCNQVEIDYLQVATLDVDAIMSHKVVEPEASLNIVKEKHKPEMDVQAVQDMHDGCAQANY
jgi:hypothetical protein